jgi:hypothetical protein
MDGLNEALPFCFQVIKQVSRRWVLRFMDFLQGCVGGITVERIRISFRFRVQLVLHKAWKEKQCIQRQTDGRPTDKTDGHRDRPEFFQANEQCVDLMPHLL